jgi:hypothetical protein
MQPTIPDQTSNAGPDVTEDLDWLDYLWVADEDIKAARNTEQDGYNYAAPGAKLNRSRIACIDRAIEALNNAKELLCR